MRTSLLLKFSELCISSSGHVIRGFFGFCGVLTGTFDVDSAYSGTALTTTTVHRWASGGT